MRHVLIRKGFKTGEIMVCLVINGNKLPGKERLVEMLTGGDGVKGMTSISYSVNQEKTNVIMGKEIVNLYGPGYISDYIGNVKYQISPLSFYQVNPVQTERFMGQRWSMPDLREMRLFGICIAESALFHYSWLRRLRKCMVWRLCPRP